MSYSSQVLADGAVGYWRLGEALFSSAAVDQTGNSNGTYTNSAGITLGQTGILGGSGDTACQFTSASLGYMAIPDVAAQNVADTFSAEGWVKRTTGSLIVIYCATASNKLQFDVASGTLRLVWSGVSVICSSTSTISADGILHHCVATKTGSAVHLYIDGVDVSGSVTNQTVGSNTGGSWIGRAPVSNYSDGVIDEVALYPTVLTPTQVSNHHAIGSTAPSGQPGFQFGFV